MALHSPRSDLLGGFAWLGFGLLLLVESLRMERFTKMGASLYTMPGFVPGMLGCIIALLGLALSWRGWRRSKALTASPPAEASDPLINQRLGQALPLCLIYAAGLIGRVPFWLATSLFVTVFTYCFTPKDISTSKRVAAAIASGLLTSVVVIGVFQYIFLVRLP
jgi:hypothetical protein